MWGVARQRKWLTEDVRVPEQRRKYGPVSCAQWIAESKGIMVQQGGKPCDVLKPTCDLRNTQWKIWTLNDMTYDGRFTAEKGKDWDNELEGNAKRLDAIVYNKANDAISVANLCHCKPYPDVNDRPPRAPPSHAQSAKSWQDLRCPRCK